MPSMRQFIIRKLKENVPLSEIRKDLQEKGYGIEIINKAVREVISGVDKKLPRATVIQIGILVVGVALAIGVAVYLTGSRTTEVRTLLTFTTCESFINDISSCQNAVITSLKSYPGEVLKITKQSDGWEIKIKLGNPLMSRDSTPKDNISVLTNPSGNAILKLVV